NTYARTGRLKNALTEYQLVLKSPGSRALAPQALYRIGELSRKLGQTADAAAAWQRLRGEYPDDPLVVQALLGLAGLEQDGGHFSRASVLAREVADRSRERRLDALLIVGDSALAGGSLRDAEDGYARALADAPAGSLEGQRAAAGLIRVGERYVKAGQLDGGGRGYRLVERAAPARPAPPPPAAAGPPARARARGAGGDARARSRGT